MAPRRLNADDSASHSGVDPTAWIEVHHRAIKIVLVAAFALVAAFVVLNAAFSDDETFYISGAQLAGEGKAPYVDYFFPQSPLAAYAYAFPATLGAQPYAARFVSLAFGLAAILVAMRLADQWGGRVAGVLTGGILASSLLLAAFAGTVSPHPLVGFFLVAAMAALAMPARTSFRYAVAAALLAAGAAVRLNLVVALPLLAAYALVFEPRRERLAAVAGAIPAAAAVLAVAYVPFLFANPSSAQWSLVGYHLEDGRESHFTLLHLLKFKLDGIRYFILDYPFATVSTLFAASYVTVRHGRTPLALARANPLLALASALVLLLLAVTFTKTYVQSHYLAQVMPLLAVVLGVFYARLLGSFSFEPRRALTMLLAAFLVAQAVGAAPFFLAQPSEARSIATTREAARLIADATPEDATVFTFTPILAQYADRRLVPGTEMGHLAFYPAMSDARADEVHVINAARVEQLLAAREPAALALRAKDFSYSAIPLYHAPAGERAAMEARLWGLVEARYAPVATYGAGPDALTIWLPKPMDTITGADA